MIVGIDLSAKESNPTGLCFLNNHKAITKEVFPDLDIIKFCRTYKPNIIAIDSPLSIGIRECDRSLKKFGAMPQSLHSMKMLAYRAINLIEKLQKLNSFIVEVFPTGTAKILGIYDKNRTITMNNLFIKFGFCFKGIFSKHEIDAILSAITGLMWESNLCLEVGDNKGKIIIPNAEKMLDIYNYIRNIEVISI